MSDSIDPGMAIKMTAKCFPEIQELDKGKTVDESGIRKLIAFVNARYDCADFRLICLLKTRISYATLLSAELLAELDACILGFRYWMDEPGSDGMCFWSENHQLLFATCEYLAGQLFPEAVFSNNGQSGSWHRDKARVKLLRWLEQRFTYGIIEWHSNTYYEEDIAPLSVLVDLANDNELQEKAKIILDLFFLDLALHSFEGYLVASSGRCYEEQKKNSSAADVNDILAHTFGILKHELDYSRLSALFLLCKNYRVPEPIRAIAQSRQTMTIRDSMGLDLTEVKKEFPEASLNERGMFLWAMEAFTNPESINMTMRIFNAWKLKHNNFLKDLQQVNLPVLRQLGLLPPLVRLLNPATQGVAIQRANTYTYKTANYMLSTAQHYHPGEFGDQQHIWQATLPGQVNIFSTHPGSPMFDDASRNFSPSYWVGNGILPQAMQEENMLLLLYRLGGRKGYLERQRQDFVHFHFPAGRLDESRITEQLVCGRKGESYIGIISTVPAHIQEDELVYRGRNSGFAIILGDKEDSGNFERFIRKLEAYQLQLSGRSLRFVADKAWQMAFQGNCSIDGRVLPRQHPRLDCPFSKAERKPAEFVLTTGAGSWRLSLNEKYRGPAETRAAIAKQPAEHTQSAAVNTANSNHTMESDHD